MGPLRLVRDERGMTLIELLVATSAGTVIFFGLTMMVIASMHQTTRLTDRVHATQEARTVLHRIVSELHSACIAPQLAPIQEKSTDTSLIYVSQKDGEEGLKVSPTPVKRVVALSGTTLTESIYEQEGTSTPWVFKTSPTVSARPLMTNLSAISGVPLFSYYAYSGGQVSSTPLPTTPPGLSVGDAAKAVQVNIALKVTPQSAPVKDAKGAGVVQDSALLRLSSPTFATAGSNLPCE